MDMNPPCIPANNLVYTLPDLEAVPEIDTKNDSELEMSRISNFSSNGSIEEPFLILLVSVTISNGART